MRILSLSPLLLFAHAVYADQASLSPPGLKPLIDKANVLLSSGQFNDAAKAFSEAIEQSPADYLLYYKRATAYLSLNRHPSALDDFEKVLSLTSNTFDRALLMKAKIQTKEGEWSAARDSLQRYSKAKPSDATAASLLEDIKEGESAAKKADQALRSHLWTACSESASSALRVASHSVQLRQQRAECALAAGDLEGAVGDLTRLTHLTTPSPASLARLFRLSYFFLPSSDSSVSTAAMAPLKHCLRLDPDSKLCLPAHRLVKKFDKTFAKLDKLAGDENWRGIINLLVGSGKDKDKAFLKSFDDALESHTTPEQLAFDTASSSAIPASVKMPVPNASKQSPRKIVLLRAICKAYTQVNLPKSGHKWCEALLAMEGAGEDVDGLVGMGEAMLAKEEWEDGVRYLEKAFEASGRSSRDIQQRLHRAQKLLKQSRQKDYYKVLGVSRDADDRTIKKAYRKAVLTAHPDKGGTEEKMAAVNEAYEVLSKPELRQRFDNGEDPNDPMAQQGGHPFAGGFQGSGHPFAQFFQQGGHPGGGGFQFQYSGGW